MRENMVPYVYTYTYNARRKEGREGIPTRLVTTRTASLERS